MKRVTKIITYVLFGLLAIGTILISYLMIGFPKVDAAPEFEIAITDEYVERGRYLSHHVMMCADCHSVRDYSLFSGPPSSGTMFAGGDIFDESMGFPGRFVSSNITPHGLNEWTDGELYRLITTGVKKDGDPIFPVMPYHSFGKLDPEDIRSVIAFLRTLDPVVTDHPESKVGFPMNLIMRTMPKKAEPVERPQAHNAIAYGAYLINAASCNDCHTKFENGKFVGPPGGGGREFVFPDGSILRSPNLTPHETGINYLNKESFIQLFKKYAGPSDNLAKIAPGDFQTLMPWYMYSGMSEEDLGAIYEYLKSLPPHENEVVRFEPAN